MTYILLQLRKGQIESAKDGIMSGYDLDLADVDGVTALHYAVDKELVEVVTMLLAFGADPNIINSKTELLASKVNPEHSGFNNSMLTTIIEDMQTLSTLTPLHIATKKKNFRLMKTLLDYGADPNIKDLGLCTPLHWACVQGDIEIVQLLLAFRADPNMQDLASSTPLHEAVRRNFKDIVALLLKHNSDPNIPDISGNTAYVLAQDTHELTSVIINHSNIRPSTYVSH